MSADIIPLRSDDAECVAHLAQCARTATHEAESVLVDRVISRSRVLDLASVLRRADGNVGALFSNMRLLEDVLNSTNLNPGMMCPAAHQALVLIWATSEELAHGIKDELSDVRKMLGATDA